MKMECVAVPGELKGKKYSPVKISLTQFINMDDCIHEFFHE